MQMDEQIQEVERLLGNVAMKCNVRVVDQKAANLTKWARGVEAQGTTLRVGSATEKMKGTLTSFSAHQIKINTHLCPRWQSYAAVLN